MSAAGPARPMVRAAAKTYGTNLAAVSLSLVNVMLVARILGATDRGHIALLMAIPTLTMHLGSFGVQEANANLGGARPETRPALVSNSILLALVLGGLSALVVVALVLAVPAVGGEVPRGLLWLALGSVPVLMLKLYLSLLLQSGYWFNVTNAAWVIGPVTTVTVNSACAAFGLLSVTSALSAWIGGQVLGLLLLLRFAQREIGLGRPDRALARTALGFGAKTHVGRFMEIGNYRADQWLLGTMAGSRELGLYSVAVAWAEVLFYVPGVIVLVQRPDLVRALPRDAVELASRIVRRAALLAAAAGLALLALAPVLCPLLLGAEFAGATAQLRVLALGAVGIVLLELLTNALVAQRRPLVASAAFASAFVLTVGLDLALIPSLGGMGAAIATSGAYTVGGIAGVVLFTRTLHGSPRDLVPGRADVAWYARKVRAAWASAHMPVAG